jgi:NTP pyrophosphatase (non-canonical NTP hydrolase)
MEKSVSAWVQECHGLAREKGFWNQDRNVGEMLMLIVSELGEAVEAHRKGEFGLEKKDTFEDELADTAIRLFDLCGGLGIDLEKQIAWKMSFNQTRAPKHGKNY